MNSKLLFCLFFLGFLSASFSQDLDPLMTQDSTAQDVWVEKQLNSMSLNEKIGQLFMVQAYSNKDKKHRKKIESQIRKYKIGGLIFMQGTPEKQAVLTNRYQKKSKLPLLIGMDGEWGLDMRLKNTFRYPWNMSLGAIQNDHLIRQYGKRLGAQCKRMGIHVNFAPVVDINTNPKNPIIGNRSFGENKFNVTDKAVSFIHGLQSERVLSNAKHFPGHGDTDSDSHKTLPQVSFNTNRLENVEMYPYKNTFDRGLASVMVAHLSVPALEKDSELPTSLSYDVVTRLLQEEMGFKGLVFTDALNMKGVSNYAKPGDVDLAAFLAGNDVLLIPKDVGAAVKKIKRAYREKRFTINRLNRSVKKILKAKYWAGLHQYKPIELENLQNDLNTVQDSLLRSKLVKNAITLLQNKEAVFPIKDLKAAKIAYLKLGDAPSDDFLSTLNKYKTVTEVKGRDRNEILRKLIRYNTVIVGCHASNNNPWKRYKFSEDDLRLLEDISKNTQIILTVFSTPYSLLDVKSFEDIEGVLVAYQNSPIVQRTAAQMIFGALETKGKLPVSIGVHFQEGIGLESTHLMRLSYGLPESVGMHTKKLQKIDSLVEKVIEARMCPGAQVLIARYGTVVYQKSFGFHTYDQKRTVQNTDLYDLASLTKILGGLPLIMKSEEFGILNLEDSLSDLLQDFKGTNKDTLTVKALLSHNAGLRAWIPFFLETQDTVTKKPLTKYYRTNESTQFNIEVAKNMYLRTDYIDSLYQKIKDSDIDTNQGYKYSGLAFYIFKEYLESNFLMGMDKMAETFFYNSLGAETLTYNPLQRFKINRIVPSEIDTYFRHQVLQGHVHDMGAAMVGGVSGNAGLFSNANDVAKLMQMYLQGGYYGGHRYLESQTLYKFNKRYFKEAGVRRGLGFDKPQLDPEILATCGCVSDLSFGHSGFTGTYTWADPGTGLLYVFLSNRTYPSMDNNKLVEENIRTRIQALVVEALVK